MGPATAKKDLFWANLVHISFEMWWDRELPPDAERKYYEAKPYLRVDDALWNDILAKMRAAGMNMLVLDLGNGVQYRSHPEIALKNAWSTGRLREELAKCRELGLEPIPKLNFSACHDFWLHPYDRMLSTPTYYTVCAELIAEVIELFDTPAFFHLGMDEETAGNQRLLRYSVVRQYDLWWHDLNLLIDAAQDGVVAERLGHALHLDDRGAHQRTASAARDGSTRFMRSRIRASGMVMARYRTAAATSGV